MLSQSYNAEVLSVFFFGSDIVEYYLNTLSVEKFIKYSMYYSLNQLKYFGNANTEQF